MSSSGFRSEIFAAYIDISSGSPSASGKAPWRQSENWRFLQQNPRWTHLTDRWLCQRILLSNQLSAMTSLNRDHLQAPVLSMLLRAVSLGDRLEIAEHTRTRRSSLDCVRLRTQERCCLRPSTVCEPMHE